MATNYSPEIVTDGAVFVGDARMPSIAEPGTRLYNKAGVDSTAVKLLIHGNEGSGQSFTDSSLSNIPIVAVGDVTHSTTQYKFSGGSIYFDGSGDYLDVGNSNAAYTDVFYDVNGLDFTYDFWVYRTGSGRRGLISSYPPTGGSYDDIELEFTSANKIMCGFRSSPSVFHSVTTTSVLSADTWYHVALIRHNGLLKIYVNGTLEHTNSTVWTGDIENRGGALLVGTYAAMDHQGYMDEIRITIGSALWTQNFTPPARRDTLSISDGMMYNGTCLDFDGSDDYVLFGSYTPGNGSWTVSMWVNADAFSNYTLLSNTSGSPVASAFYISTAGKISYANYDASPGWSYHYGDTTLSTGTWYFCTWVNYAGASASTATMKMFVNGVADSSEFGSVFTTNGGPVDAIGRQTGNYFNGKIADVKFYDVSLSDANVKELYDDSRVIIPSNVSQTNFKRWWSFVEGAGVLTYDGSGNQADGTMTNMTSADWLTGQTGAPQLVEGYNRVMLFDGSSDYVNCGASSGLVTGNTLSISAWVKNDGTVKARVFQGQKGSGSTSYSLAINNNTGSVAAGYVSSLTWTGSVHEYVSYDASLDDGAWHHLAMTTTASAQKLYVDGALVASGTFTFSNAASADFASIGSVGGGSEFADGVINEVILYDSVLSLAQVQALAATGPNGGPLPPDAMSLSNSSDIVAYWRNDSNTTWKNRGPQVVKNFTDVATDPINDSNAVGGWTNNGTSLTSVVGGRTGFIDGAMRVAPRYRFLFDSAINCTVNSIISVTSGKSYKVSAWFKGGTSTTARLIVTGGYYDSGNFTASSTVWTNKTDIFTATSTGNVTVELHNRAAGTMYFDDVTCVESGPALDGTVSGSPDALLFKQGYNGQKNVNTGRDGQGFPLKYKDVGAVGFDADATDYYINIAASTELDNIWDGGGTTDTWIYPASDGESDGGRIYEKTQWNLLTHSQSGTNVKLQFYFKFTGTDGTWDTTSAVVPINEWSHIVVAYNADNVANNPTIYINGVAYTVGGGLTESTTPTSVRESDAGEALQIGNNDTPSRTFDGQIYGLKIYNRALSQAEIKQNYNAQKSRFT
jgi:hypothetical protein